jgi:hypothetical protein
MQLTAIRKLFKFREAETQIPIVTMSCSSLITVAPPPCLPLDLKDLLKEDSRPFGWGRLFDGEFWLEENCCRGKMN